jgi:hypothetical protein
MTIEHRPLSDRQRSELNGYAAPAGMIVRAVLFCGAGTALGGVLYYFTWLARPGTHFLWWLLPTLAVMAVVYIRSKRWTGGAEFRRQIRADLARGVAEARRFEIAEAVKVEEREDEGPSFFLKTADGQIFIFSGQYLDTGKNRSFPWASFEVLEAPESRRFFGLHKLGEPLKPSFVRQPFDGTEFKRYCCQHYRQLEEDFDSLKVKAAAMEESKENRTGV